MDTVNPNGYADGSLDPAQFAWLKTTIESATGKAVMVFSHHTSSSMTNPFVATGGDPNPRVLGDEVTAYLLSQPRLIAWVNGHTHRNEITAHKRADGSGGFWEINTAAHIDYPQQSRLHRGRPTTATAPCRSSPRSSTTPGRPTTSGDLSLDGEPRRPVARAVGQRPAAPTSTPPDVAGDRNTELLVRKPADMA